MNLFPNNTLSGGSLFTSILPMIEQASSYNLYDFNLGNSDPYNVGVTGQKIPAYLCPSSPMRRAVPGCDSDAGRAPGNYAVNIGSTDYNQYWSFFGEPQPSLNGAIVFSDTSDGTTHTLLVGETACNLPDYVFSSGGCIHQPRYSFTYWSVPYPGSTACTTPYAFNPHDVAGDGLFDANCCAPNCRPR